MPPAWRCPCSRGACRRAARFRRPRFAALRIDELPRFGGAVDDHLAALAAGVFHHHDRVGAGRDGRAGHDLHCLARADDAVEALARAHFADDFERAGQIDGAHCVAIADGARERRRIAVGGDIFRQHASRRLGKSGPLGGRLRAQSAHHAENGLASFRECHHRHTPIISAVRISVGAQGEASSSAWVRVGFPA